MKKEIHPKNYRPVLFIDNSDGTEFIIPSTVVTKEIATRSTGSGQEAKKVAYPVFRVEISSATHPFYTGEIRTLDTAGRVERFKQKQAKAKPARQGPAGGKK